MRTGRIRGAWRAGRLGVVIATVVGLVLVPTVAWASLFPINEPFHTATTNNPAWTHLGSATLTNQGTG